MKKILVIEDDVEINNLIKDFFMVKKFEVEQAFSGTEALIFVEQNDFDCLILDLMLPKIDGEAILEVVKSRLEIPIIVVSAKDKDESRILSLKLGADDFLQKPFNIEELFLKVEKNIEMYRRLKIKDTVSQDMISYGNISMSFITREVTVNNQKLHLTSKEFDMLALLIKSPNRVFTRENLFFEVWGEEFCIDTNTVSVHISNLRKKLKKIDKDAPQIETVWGIGFKMSKN
ncbi:response regulator transcription factor [Thomasclavelia sp.]